MRLPEAKLKEALLHPEKLVRDEALRYFTDCYSRDTEIMAQAIEAVAQYGRQEAFQSVYSLAKLAQTEATVEWAIRELHRGEDRSEDEERYLPDLSQLLCSADPALLAPRADAILHAPGFDKELVPAFQERLELATWDADQCWKELERISAEGVGKLDVGEVDFDHGSRVVEALARQGEKYVDRMLELLTRKVENYETEPMTWLEIFLVMLAGEMRLERAIPLLVRKLHQCEEVLSEECVEALAKIGTDGAAEAITEGWLEAEWDYRIYGVGALQKIHTDTTVRKCLDLLPRDEDFEIRTWLADALLCQFAEEGIEPVREMVQGRAYDPMASDLMRQLVIVSTVLGVTFDEYPIWKREVEKKQAQLERRMKEFWRSFQAPSEPALPPEPAPPSVREPFPERKPVPFLRTEKPVGRNDPCPCGSGKKFKKCCMNKNKG